MEIPLSQIRDKAVREAERLNREKRRKQQSIAGSTMTPKKYKSCIENQKLATAAAARKLKKVKP